MYKMYGVVFRNFKGETVHMLFEYHYQAIQYADSCGRDFIKFQHVPYENYCPICKGECVGQHELYCNVCNASISEVESLQNWGHCDNCFKDL